MKTGRRALLSVSDKRDLVPFARELVRCGFELVSTGGTAQTLRQAGLAVREIASLTGMPELLGGRVKTLHPAIHAAILARDTASDREELERHGIEPIDLVAVDLYPFERAAERGGPLETLLEQIDIGGSTLLRAAAKNWPRVVVVPGRAHYEQVLTALRSTGEVGAGLRRTLALRAFERSAAYDAAIAAAWAMRTGEAQPAPERLVRLWQRERPLRYGENPHQAAVLYRAPFAPPEVLARAVPLQGKPLSYNNLLDAHAAWSLLAEVSGDRHAAVIVKHTNPCGAAVADTIEQAYEAALATDPRSAFGGVLALSAAPGPALASRIAARFFELLLAPEFDPEARTELARRPALRLLALGPPHRPAPCWTGREIEGGLLWQQRDVEDDDPSSWRVVGARQPEPDDLVALRFAWRVCRHVLSNAITLARGTALVGVGAGQMSRVEAVELAVGKAGERARGAVLASDAFFPFPDAIECAAKAGVRAIVAPGGSRRDAEVIAAADAAGIALLFAARRHFRH